jgi:hypothetical protein
MSDWATEGALPWRADWIDPTGCARAANDSDTDHPMPGRRRAVADSFEAMAQRPVSDEVLADECFSKIERLANLRDCGILTHDEFESQKAELLRRI